MKLVDRYFSDIDREAIGAAVTNAERHTSAEIAVRLTEQCRKWQLERWLYSLCFACVFAIVALLISASNSWTAYGMTEHGVLWGIVGLAFGFFVWYHWVLFRPRRRAKFVRQRANRVFRGLTPTQGQTGVLIFLAMKERRAEIVVGQAISRCTFASDWRNHLNTIISNIKQDRHAEGIIQAIRSIGPRLAELFPRAADDTNELSDAPEEV